MYKKIIAGAAAVVLAAEALPAVTDISSIVASASGGLVFSLNAPAAVTVGDSGKTDGTETVLVSVDITDNPGAQSWTLLLDYDSSALTYDTFVSDSFGGMAVFDKGGQLVINDFEMNNNTTKGTAVTLQFKVKQNLTEGSYTSFKLKLDDDLQNYFNYNEEQLTPSISSDTGALTVQKITNLVKVDSVQLNTTTMQLSVGESSQLEANVLPVNATNQNVTFRSSAPDVATVDSMGNIKGISAGTAVITATSAEGGKTARCNVTVQAVPVTGITLGTRNLELTAGDSETLTWTLTPQNATNTKVSFTSSNLSVAKVNQNGRITAEQAGTCDITATTEDGSFKDVCHLTVKPRPVTFTCAFTKDSIDIVKGSTADISFTVTSDDPDNTFNKTPFETVSNWNFAVNTLSVIDLNTTTGRITAKEPGTATITATHPNYVDANGHPIPLTLTVNVTASNGISAKLAAYNAPEGTELKVKLLSGSTKVAEKTVSAGESKLFAGVADGKYTVVIESSYVGAKTSYAPLSKEIEIVNGTAELDETLYLYGDITKNGIIDEEDLSRLQQYVSDWAISYPYLEVLNVKRDNDIDTADISRFQQYLGDWNVSLGK